MIGILILAFIVAFFLWKCSNGGSSSSKRKTPTFATIPLPLDETFSDHSLSTSSTSSTPDRYKSYTELQLALKQSGLESSSLIVGVDFTKSNEWTGRKTYGGMSLHALTQHHLNPYQSVIQIVGKTLEVFDDDKLIPAFGFGDSTTQDRAVFSFKTDGSSCRGFQEVLERYTALVPGIVLQGPTSFAPLIREAIKVVRREKAYHILVIIADGQVTNEAETRAAIVEASRFPISIILIGVGDGPWEKMEEFDDGLPERTFDNFQFVNFHDVMTRYDANELAFACTAMQEIPEQYQTIKRLNLFKNC